jgi:hypothetical protein
MLESVKRVQTTMKIMSLFILIILLTACQSAFITDLLTQSGQALYHDDFSDPTDGWPEASDAIGSLGYSQGAYRVVVNSAGYDLWAVSRQSYGDVQVEVDTARLAGTSDNRFGLICRYQDVENFYVFIISSDGYYATAIIRDGTSSLLGQEMMAYNAAIIHGDGPNHIRFDCIGNALTGYVNGQRVAVANDSTFTTGDAGLLAGAFDEGGVEISFDNFMVIKP